MTVEVQEKRFEHTDGGFTILYPDGASTVFGKEAHSVMWDNFRLKRFLGVDRLAFEHESEILEDATFQGNRCYDVALWASHENCTYQDYTQCYTVSSGDCTLLATDYLQKHPFHALTEMVIASSKEEALAKFQKWQKEGLDLEYLATI